MNDLFGMLFWSITFYLIHAIVHFDFLDMKMTPVTIAMLNTVFRIATVMILFPFIKWIERLVFKLVKDSAEDREDQADFDLLINQVLFLLNFIVTLLIIIDKKPHCTLDIFNQGRAASRAD